MPEGVANAAADAPSRQLTTGESRRSGLARWVWPAALALAAVVLFLCYLRLSGTTPDNSDGSDQAM